MPSVLILKTIYTCPGSTRPISCLNQQDQNRQDEIWLEMNNLLRAFYCSSTSIACARILRSFRKVNGQQDIILRTT